MGTRSGDIDPAIVQFIAQKENQSLDEVINELNKKSGYLGLSELSSDSRDLWDAFHRGDEKAKIAVEKQAKMIADYIGAYYLTLGGVDAICFTAGIGENSPETRALVSKRLSAIKAFIDPVKNDVRGKEAVISTDDSLVQLFAVPTNEEVMIARDTVRLIK
jgi:acetate kinase